MKTLTTSICIFLILLNGISAKVERLVWPPPPAEAKVEFIKTVPCNQLNMEKGFLKSISSFLAGKSDEEYLSLPFDLKVTDEKIYCIFLNIPALIEIDRSNNNYKYHTSKQSPLTYPISLAVHDNIVYVTDVENKGVYKLENNNLTPLITSGLIRPTGITISKKTGHIYIVDTGDHSVKLFDLKGNFIKSVTDPEDTNLNFPTFAESDNSTVYINDALNFKVKRFTHNGELISSFGGEGNGPGTFARPKGISIDSDGHIYVVDNLYDNIQIFDSTGQVLLVIGNRGQLEGQFWSPTGIDIHKDTIYIADTFNDRIQVLHYLGEAK